jgi:hypothetical protein
MEEILGLLGSVIGSFTQNSQTNSTQKQLNAMMGQNVISPYLVQGEHMLEEQTNEGIANYQGQREEIQSELPTSLNEIKDAASAGTLLDTFAKFQSGQNKQLRALANQNAQAKMGNKANLAQYMAGVMGPADQQRMETNAQLQLGKIITQQQGNASQQKNLMQGLGDIGKFGDSDNSGWLAGLFGNSPSQAVKKDKFTVPKTADIDWTAPETDYGTGMLGDD